VHLPTPPWGSRIEERIGSITLLYT